MITPPSRQLTKGPPYSPHTHWSNGPVAILWVGKEPEYQNIPAGWYKVKDPKTGEWWLKRWSWKPYSPTNKSYRTYRPKKEPHQVFIENGTKGAVKGVNLEYLDPVEGELVTLTHYFSNLKLVVRAEVKDVGHWGKADLEILRQEVERHAT